MKSYSREYLEDLLINSDFNFPWESLNGKKILITGGSGLIGEFLVDVLMQRNMLHGDNIKVCVLARNEEKIKNKFGEYLSNPNFSYLIHDISYPLLNNDYDYIIHAASNTHPVSYANDPIGTITTNIIGTYNLLKNCKNDLKKFILLSSVEIYGQNRGDVDKFDENYCGYIDCNTLRAGYPESKRLSEALCQAYIKQKGFDITIARLARVYGPTDKSDSKASAQFIRNGINSEDIVLKSKGDQVFSYIYYADAINGLLHVLFYGKSGEAYNISNDDNGISLFDFATTVANCAGTKVIRDIPNETEQKGFSVVTKAIMDVEKLKQLGWKQQNSMENGISKTIKKLKKEK